MRASERALLARRAREHPARCQSAARQPQQADSNAIIIKSNKAPSHPPAGCARERARAPASSPQGVNNNNGGGSHVRARAERSRAERSESSRVESRKAARKGGREKRQEVQQRGRLVRRLAAAAAANLALRTKRVGVVIIIPGRGDSSSSRLRRPAAGGSIKAGAVVIGIIIARQPSAVATAGAHLKPSSPDPASQPARQLQLQLQLVLAASSTLSRALGAEQDSRSSHKAAQSHTRFERLFTFWRRGQVC